MAFLINGRPSKSPMAPLLFGGVFAVAGLVPLFLALTQGSGALALFGLVFLGVGGAIMAQGIRQLVSRLAFREAELQPLRETWKLGSKARFKLQLEPKRPLQVVKATVRLATLEYAYYSAGSDSRTYTETLHQWDGELSLPASLDRRLEQELEVEIPRTIPPTWTGRHNRFETTVEVKVQIDQWPDLSLTQTLRVAPEEA